MKKIHIVILVCIAAGIMVLLSFMGDLSTYETLASARQKEGKQLQLLPSSTVLNLLNTILPSIPT
ncbi:hypothetical protein [Paraflavitalea speifideaquila]|uniref:hypothetical protein n=1 Tax=Paraflavitalea speifideaquila TaxID=3076558 RepID=UPI0028E5861E|nr:hypothetical protein [Paraflavitalea speifideiaquila]